MVMTITDVLNIWNEVGVFSYLIPFLLIFAVVFAILQKTKILGDGNKTVQAIVALAVGLLALQLDFVSDFFAVIFPRFGIGLSIFLVLVILIGFFYQPTLDGSWTGAMKWVGWLTGVGVVVWAIVSWDDWRGYPGFGIGYWFQDYFWALVILAAVIGVIVTVAKSGDSGREERGTGGSGRGG